ncbi:DUF167 domain-containing protein [Chloroflexota bacterium]
MSSTQVMISLRVHPNADTNELVSFIDGALRVRVAAPPVKGKANKELVAFLSKVLGISKGSLTIVKGHTSRNKVIAIDGLSQTDISQRLSPKLSSSGGATTSDRGYQ